jgi:hypothetical protein
MCQKKIRKNVYIHIMGGAAFAYNSEKNRRYAGQVS